MVVVESAYRNTQKALNRKAGAGRITSGPLSQRGAWRSAAKLFTTDEARLIAANIAKLVQPAVRYPKTSNVFFTVANCTY
jgi:hypothetical protein